VVDVSRTEKGSGRARRGGSRSTGQTTLCFARRCWSSSRRRPRTLPLPPPEAVPRRLCPPSPRLSIRMQAVRGNPLRVHGGCGIFLMGRQQETHRAECRSSSRRCHPHSRRRTILSARRPFPPICPRDRCRRSRSLLRAAPGPSAPAPRVLHQLA
jgi:hypothetical protein